jgi:hypothetical protein
MFKHLALVLLYLLISSPVVASSNWNIEAQQSFYATGVESKRMEARTMGVGLDLITQREISPELFFKVDAGVRLENGSHKALDLAEFSPNQQVLLNEGLLLWKPWDFLDLQVGGLNQRHFSSPLFIDHVVFVGAGQQLLLKWGDYQFYLKLQQLIPNNRNLSTRLGSIDEGTPQFLSETLGINLAGDLVSLKIEGTMFAFTKLSPSVAHQSRFMGNSVSGVASDSARFNYTYQGTNVFGEMKWFFGEQSHLEFQGHYLFNRKAPDDRNTAMMARAGLQLSAWSSGLALFESQSDSTIAFYNSKALGHTNRKGFAVDLGLSMKNGDFSLVWARSNPLQNNIFQSKADIISLNYTHRFKVL